MATNRFFKNINTFGTITVGDSLFLQLGNTAILTNPDQSGLAAGGLDVVNVAREWLGNIGTEAAPFRAEINVDAGSVFNYDAGGGECFYFPDSVAGADECLKLRVTGEGVMHVINGGQITELIVNASLTTIELAVVVPTIRVGWNGEVQLENEGAATRPTLVEIGGNGVLKSQRGVDGIVDQWDGLAVWDVLTEAFTTYNLMGGECDLGESGDFVTFNWRKGKFNPRRLNREVTITNLNIWEKDINPQDLADVLGHPLLDITNTNFV